MQRIVGTGSGGLVAALSLLAVASGCGGGGGGLDNVYGSCHSTSCTDMQFGNNVHTPDLHITIVSGTLAAEDYGPLTTDGSVFLVSADVTLGQVFTFSAGTGAVRGAPVDCKVGPDMLPSAMGFGTVLVSGDAGAQTASIFCQPGPGGNWQ